MAESRIDLLSLGKDSAPGGFVEDPVLVDVQSAPHRGLAAGGCMVDA